MFTTMPPYRDRIEAGQVLARHLAPYASRVDTLVLALPPGGVPIAIEVAKYLNAPVDTFTVRMLGLPQQPEVVMGALAPGGVRVLDDALIEQSGVTPAEVAEVTALESAELDRQQAYFRGNRPFPAVMERLVIVIDDGLDTGLAMHAAVIALHRQQPTWLVAAIPVGSIDACDELAKEVHEMVCPFRPEPFQSIGLWYDHFSPTDDEQVRAALRRANQLPAA